MAALRTLGGIFVAAAGVLAVAALVSQSSRNGSGIGARQGQGRGPRIEFSWTVPDRDEARPTPKVAMRGSELQTEMMPARHAHRHHAVMVAEHRRSKHR